jgi:hypothetical protein
MQKEGIDYLRSLAGNNLRIVTNFSIGVPLRQFNDAFLSHDLDESKRHSSVYALPNEVLSGLSIICSKENVGDSQYLIMMNVRYCNEECSLSKYLILSYLMSSLIVVH